MWPLSRDHVRFFVQVGHETTCVSIGNKLFSRNNRQAYQNYEQTWQRQQNSDVQSHFLVSKIDRIFPN